MSIIKNFLYNAFYQVFVLLIPLITTPYLARTLGPTGVGINSYTNSIIQYFILFGSIGVNLYGNRQIAFIRDDRKKLSETFFEVFLMRIITIIISYIAFMFFLSVVNEYHSYYVAQSLSIIAAAFDISWFFMGMENFAVTVLRNFVIKLVTLISIFTLVKSNSDLYIYILILSLSLLIGNLTLFPSLRRYINFPNLRSLNIWKHFIPSLTLFIPQIATQIYLVVNKTMLGSMISVQSAGFFDQSDKLIKMVLAIVTATGTVMLPHVANAFAKGKKQATLKYLYGSFQFVTALSVPMVFGLMAVSAKFVPLFFTAKFNAVIPLMKVEAVVILLIAWSNVIGTQYLLPTKQVKSYTYSVIWGAVVNIIANVPLILMYGALGTAIATVISELTVTVYQLIVVRNQVNYVKLFTDSTKYIFSGFLMGVVVYTLDFFTKDCWNMLLIEVIVGIVVYMLMLLLFKVRLVSFALKAMRH